MCAAPGAVHKRSMLDPSAPDLVALTDREREQARRNPYRDTLLLAAAGAAKVLGARHSATKAFARASITMDRVDLWRARLALKTLRKDQREAIAEAAETFRSLNPFLPAPRPSARLVTTRDTLPPLAVDHRA